MQQREVQTGMMDLLRRNLGHEIRNPLGGIRGAAQMMAAELKGRELGTLAELIMREVDRIDELLARFGRPELDLEKIDIHFVLKETTELFLKLSKSFPSNFMVVKYNNLLVNTLPVVERLFQFSGLRLSNSTEQFLLESRSRNDSDAYSVFKSHARDNGWKKSLDKRIINAIESDLKDTVFEEFLN